MKRHDLGTYHLRVEFQDGMGYIQEFSTGMRFKGGRNRCYPLNAQPIQPPWESEEDLFQTMRYKYFDGGYSCDCSKDVFMSDAAQADYKDQGCGDTIKLKRLTAIRPDGSECVLWPTETSHAIDEMLYHE